MDLSQQELPLTAYFTRYSKEARSRAVSYKDKDIEDSQSAARSSKRRRSNIQCSTTSPLTSSAGQSKLRHTTLQLPTPATSARKRMRGERLEELPGKTQPTSIGVLLSPAEQNAILSSEKYLAQLEFGPTPLKSSRKGAIPELLSTPLVMPSTDRGKTIEPMDIEFLPGPRFSNHAGTGIVTPRSSSRGIFKPVHGIDNHSPLARSNCHLPSKPSQVSPRLPDPGISHVVLPHVQLSACSTPGLPRSPVDLGCLDPFVTREKNSVFVPRDGVSAPPKQCLIQSEISDGQPSDGHVIPMIRIPSSQSQYLLHPDATPKRKRCSQRIEHVPSDGHVIPTIPVPSSQSQYLLHPDATPKRKRCSQRIEHIVSFQTREERELTLSMSHKPATAVSLLVGVSPEKHIPCGNAQISRFSCSEPDSRLYMLGSSVGPPINTLAGPSRSFFATKKAPDDLSSKSLSPSQGKTLTSYHSLSCKIKTPRGPARHNSIENISPARIEDSLTESESDSDILQVLRRSPVPRDVCPPIRCGFAPGNITTEDDSATEAESDTEILHCVAEIGKKQPCEHRPEVSREDTPPPPVISPLVSPTRPRTATVPSMIGVTQSSVWEGAGLDIPGSCASYPSTMGEPQTRSESLPSVVRDFIRMFPGDESYPADFPESLRI